jgi:hypothetical protein
VLSVDNRRCLEAQRLAATGGKHDHAVAAIEDGLHRLALQRPERREAPETVKCLLEKRVGSLDLVIA